MSEPFRFQSDQAETIPSMPASRSRNLLLPAAKTAELRQSCLNPVYLLDDNLLSSRQCQRFNNKNYSGGNLP